MDNQTAAKRGDEALKTKKAAEDAERDQEVQGLENQSSLKSLGAIVFNSGTLATNVAVIKTNLGLVQRLAISAVVINCLAILVSTVLVSYGKPVKIRDLPKVEKGAVALVLSFLVGIFRFSDDRSKKRDNSQTTDDRVDELDADLLGLKEDIMALQSFVSFYDRVRLQMVYELLNRVSFNQLSNQPTKEQFQRAKSFRLFTMEGRIPMTSMDYPYTGELGLSAPLEKPKQLEVTGGKTGEPQAPPQEVGPSSPGVRWEDAPAQSEKGEAGEEASALDKTQAPAQESRKRKGVSVEDARIRSLLLCPTLIQALQMAKRVISDLDEVPSDEVVEDAESPKLDRAGMEAFVAVTGVLPPLDLVEGYSNPSLQRTRTTRRPYSGLMNVARSMVPSKSTCSWACLDTLFQGSLLRLFACCGILREDPYFDEDFWLKRKRVLLNIALIDTVRKDLAARLTESSSSWTYPLWVNQLNLLSTVLGLGVLILDIVVATYSGSEPRQQQ